MGDRASVYEQAGGGGVFERIAAEFYERVRDDDLLRPMYPDDLEAARERLALFIAQVFGGPRRYEALRGEPRLRMRHRPFSIGRIERDRWMRHMLAAVEAAGIPQPARAAIEAYFADTATFLINRPDAAVNPGPHTIALDGPA